MRNDTIIQTKSVELVVPDPTVSTVFERDMQLERSLIIGVRLITRDIQSRALNPKAAVMTAAQAPNGMVEFYDRYEEAVYQLGPISKFSLPKGRRDKLVPVRWDGLNLRLSSVAYNSDGAETPVTVVFQFSYIDPELLP